MIFLVNQIVVSGCSRKPVKPAYNLLITDPALVYVRDDDGSAADRLSNTRETFSQTHFNPRVIQSSFFTSQGLSHINQVSGLTWRPFRDADSVLQLDRLLGGGNDRIAYVAEKIVMPRDTRLYLSLGSDDGFILWVNGDSVSSHAVGRSVHADDELISVHLHRGANVMLYKVTQRDGSWGLFRAFRTKKQASMILETKLPVMFGDLPQSCILPDSASWLHLNPDSRRRVDSMHYISWRWRDWDGTALDSATHGPAYTLPDSIPLPETGKKFLLWDFSVTGSDKAVLFREQIPIAFQQEVEQRVQQIIRDSLASYRKGASAQARFKAVQSVFDRMMTHNSASVVYATRDQMQVLFGAWSMLHKSPEARYQTGVHLHGIRNPAKRDVTTWRMFSPAANREEEDRATMLAVLALHVDFDNTGDYWKTYQAQSHTLFWRWEAFSDFYRMHIISPYFSGSSSGFIRSAGDLHHILLKTSLVDSAQKTSPVTALAWSKGALTLLGLLKKPWFKVKNVALISLLSCRKIPMICCMRSSPSNRPTRTFTGYYGTGSTIPMCPYFRTGNL